jgi:inhibitor of KinA
MTFKPTYKLFGDSAILIEWPSQINELILCDILYFKNEIEKNIQLKDCIVGYNSILLVYDFLIEDLASKIESLHDLYQNKEMLGEIKNSHWKIPVCYDATFGVDLEYISKELKRSIKEIINLHAEAIYTVYFIGFLPGFLYLGGLNEQIIIPRKGTPRLNVVKGAVAIGGNQTGVYPNESSGGWNIIGNSPISFFDVQKEHPCFASPGDEITFESVSLEEYQQIKDQVENNSYQIQQVK